MAKNAYGFDDNSDLWGINPQTGRLYTVSERRQMLAARGLPSSALGGGQSSMSWDNWHDAVANANYEMTGKTPAEMQTGFAGGASPEGSNQFRGQSVQPDTSRLTAMHRDPRRTAAAGRARMFNAPIEGLLSFMQSRGY